MTEQMYRNHYAPLQLPAPGPHYSDPEYPDVDVAIIMESTYPYLKGGVSAVVHDIVCENPDLTYGIIHIAWDKNSPHEDLYGMPENVKWVKVLYLSLEVNRDAFAEACDPSALRMNFAQRQELTQRLMDGFSALIAGDVNPLWKLYDEGINPATRSYNLFGLFGTREFMQAIADLGFLSEVPFGELFWKVRDFVSILFALLHERMPHARVYHAHTTGYASLIAAAAARDHGTSFLLTEHNLYIRDTVNTSSNATWRSPSPPTTPSSTRSVSTPAWARSPSTSVPGPSGSSKWDASATPRRHGNLPVPQGSGRGTRYWRAHRPDERG